MRIPSPSASTLAVVCLVSLSSVFVLAQDRKAANRAKLPTFNPAQTNRVFFSDLFARLDGERPANPNAQVAQTSSAGIPGGGTSPASVSYAWSKLISASTLEDEIKAIKLATDKNITTPQDFAGRGYKEIRRDFSVLAMLFAIINAYDDDVRWKKDAAAARDTFARTASNAKAGNNNVYNEAKKRKDELMDLMNGSSLTTKAQEEENNWENITDQSPLMQRLEIAHDERLSSWTASEDSLSEEIERVLHEAEIVAAIAESLTQEGTEYGDDEDYVAFANAMKKGALGVVEAVKSNNADQARKSTGEISKACSDCHDGYR